MFIDSLNHLYFIFNFIERMRMMDVQVEENSPEGQVRNLICKLWTNFAKYG